MSKISKNISLQALRLVLQDRNQAKNTIPADETTHQKVHISDNVISIAPYLKNKMVNNFGGFAS